MEKDEYLGYNLLHLSRLIDRQIAKSVGRYGITNIQARIIMFVYKTSSQRAVFQKDIEEKFNIRSSSVTSVLNLMESNGYIKRVSVEKDARLKQIILLKKGTELTNCVVNSIEEVENLLSGVLTEEEKKQLLNVIDKLSEAAAE